MSFEKKKFSMKADFIYYLPILGGLIHEPSCWWILRLLLLPKKTYLQFSFF